MATRKSQAIVGQTETPADAVSSKATRGARSARTPRAIATPSTPATAAPVRAPSPTQLPLIFSTSRAALTALPNTPAHTQPPACSTTKPVTAADAQSVRKRFGELRAALADGWEIVQPIFARPLWSVTDDSTTAFNFVLRRERTTRLLTIPEGRTVQRFIRERHLLVDYRR